MNDRSFVILSLGVALVLSAGCSGAFERLPTIGRANSLGDVSSTKATSIHVHRTRSSRTFTSEIKRVRSCGIRWSAASPRQSRMRLSAG